jgi:glycosyltransferase involved in cell wall biosynthesis
MTRDPLLTWRQMGVFCGRQRPVSTGRMLQEQQKPFPTLCLHRMIMRILVIDPYMPLFDCASGYRRLLEMLKLLAARKASICFVACEGRNQERYAFVLRALGIEVYAGNPDATIDAGTLMIESVRGQSTDLNTLLRHGHYDIALLSYYQTAETYLATVRRQSPSTRIFIDTVDVHFVREQREAELHKDTSLFRQAAETKRRELVIYSQADAVITATDQDRQQLSAELPSARFHVIPNIHELTEHVPPWEKRTGLLFVGNFHHRPNRDAARFLCSEIMPRVWRTLPNVYLTIVGFAVPDEILAFAGERIAVVGHVPEITPYLQQARVSVAPLRFGAGLKGKIGEALGAGTPVVTTAVGAEGMPLSEHPNALLIAEGEDRFAEAIVRLYQDESLWNLLSADGRELISRHYSPQVVAQFIDGVFAEKEPLSASELPCVKSTASVPETTP